MWGQMRIEQQRRAPSVLDKHGCIVSAHAHPWALQQVEDVHSLHELDDARQFFQTWRGDWVTFCNDLEVVESFNRIDVSILRTACWAAAFPPLHAGQTFL